MSNTYDMIHIQQTITPFYIILENDKDNKIRQNRNYYETINKVFCDLLKKYKKGGVVVDYNKDNCFFALTSHINNFKTFYINKNQNYNSFVKRSCMINDIRPFFILNNIGLRNKILKNQKIDFLICNELKDIYLTKRIFNKQFIQNIFILGNNKIFNKSDYDILLTLIRKGYRFYNNNLKMISLVEAQELIESTYESLCCIHHTSRYFESFIVTFD
tara:strand:+ start:378 stop:1025 length:648 start_codon:yes stop_codon:yes gene_type:complete